MPAQGPVITRFAPSPTGALHVGGARTALFNWAFARKNGGKFILRIEDTDRARSSDEATAGIIRDLNWLGIDWDEGPDTNATSWSDGANQLDPRTVGPFFQSQRLEVYREHLQRLIDADRAYEDATGGGAYRFKMPGTDIVVNDEVRGQVVTPAKELDDFVIYKSDGFPTYHFAVVIDDALMGVTHVIRGQEHLSNTPKHVALQDALGFDRPTYAHLGLIFNPDGSKMSKRDKAKVARKAWEQNDKPHDISALSAKCADWYISGSKLDPPRGSQVRDAFLHHYATQLLEPNLDVLKGKTSFGRHATEADEAGYVGAFESAFQQFLDKQSDSTVLASLLARELGIHLPEIDVLDFHRSGYLPDVLCNYLALLGWNPGGNVERFDRDFLIEKFDLSRIQKGNAKFDREKLFRFNADTIAGLPAERFAELLREHFAAVHPEVLAKLDDAQFAQFAAAYQPRARTLSEPAEIGQFFFTDDEMIAEVVKIAAEEDKNVKKALLKNDGEGLKVLAEFRDELAKLEPWTGEAAHALIQTFCEQRELGMGKVAQPLRVAVSGGTVTPPIDATLAILGKEKTLNRVDACLKLMEKVAT